MKFWMENNQAFLKFLGYNYEHVKKIIVRSILIFIILLGKKVKNFLVNLKHWDNARSCLLACSKLCHRDYKKNWLTPCQVYIFMMRGCESIIFKFKKNMCKFC